jgi:dihydrofolate synthase / folylpolyglutamate synthase
MQFAEAAQYLLSLGHETLTIKLGLRNTELLLQALDNPERSFTSVQIAGTNGKGSTAAMLDSISRAAGIRTGLYTSPHLVSITERIRIAGSDITPEDFARHASTVRAAAEDLVAREEIKTPPTFFEHVTAIALIAFREAGVELAILETGLGGRLDSTTAVKAGIVGITQIAMDHEEYLGHTLASIASEKAAVIRPGVTAVIGQQDPEALAVLLDRCQTVGVQPSLEPGENFKEQISLSLRGAHQIQNASVAIRLAQALNISRESIIRGLKRTQHPGRLELIDHNPSFLLDGAHNPAGAEALRNYLAEFHDGPLTLVFGAMRDKKLDQITRTLFPLANCLILTLINNPRSASLETLASFAKQFAPNLVIETTSSTEAAHTAIAQTPPGGLICITGSLYLIGETRPLVLKLAKEKA